MMVGTETKPLGGIACQDAMCSVTYRPQDDSVCKTYDLAGGRSVGVVPLKGLVAVIRESGTLPFDVCVCSTTHDLAFRGRTEVLGIPECLVLRYEDVILEDDPGRFTDGLAREVVSHLAKYGDAKAIGFACDAGTSRSPAMAAAYLRQLGLDDWCVWGNPHFAPNSLVYRVMARAWGIRVSKEEAEALSAANEIELTRMIRSTYRASCGALPAEEVMGE